MRHPLGSDEAVLSNSATGQLDPDHQRPLRP
jgi:hypothetical protein